MAVANERGRSSAATSRGRSSANGSSRGRSKGAASQGRQSQGKQSSAAATRSSSATRKRAQGRSAQTKAKSASTEAGSASRPASGNHRADGQGAKDAITSIVIPVASATIGVAGGILLGRSALSRNRKVLGISMPNKVDLTGVGQQIGEAGRQFGKLAHEVRTVREKAEQVGRVLR